MKAVEESDLSFVILVILFSDQRLSFLINFNWEANNRGSVITWTELECNFIAFWQFSEMEHLFHPADISI